MEDLGPEINILNWFFTAFAIIMVTLRLISRLKLKPSLAGWDDVAIVYSLILVVIYSFLTSYAVRWGAGRHAADLSPENMIKASRWAFIANCFAIFTFTTPKVAIALLLDRVLGGVSSTKRWDRILLYGPAAFMMVFGIADEILWIAQCRPVYGNWNKKSDAKCLSGWVYATVAMIYSILSVILDFYYAIYPIVRILKLNMELRRKIGFAVMFGFGIVAAAVGIYKLPQILSLADPTADGTWAISRLLYCTSLEANTVIIAACVPTIGPVSKFIYSSITGTSLFSSIRNKKFMHHSYQEFPSNHRMENASQHSDERPLAKHSQYELNGLTSGSAPSQYVSRTENGAEELAIGRQVEVEVHKELAPPGQAKKLENDFVPNI